MTAPPVKKAKLNCVSKLRFNKQQQITSDFDKAVKRIQGEKSGKK